MEELWKPIAKSKYEVSNLGRIRSHARNGKGWPRFLKLNKNTYGYLNASVMGRTRAVHTLVATAFIGPANGKQVNHIDCDKENNAASNLEWVTPKENTRHAQANGLLVAPPSQAILTKKQVLKIRKLYAEGELSGQKIAFKFKVSKSCVYKILQGKNWR